jgi:hypothetical protein
MRQPSLHLGQIEEELSARPRMRQALAGDQVVNLARAQPEVAGDLGNRKSGGRCWTHGGNSTGRASWSDFQQLGKIANV